jgi:hypothetical protein
MAVVQYGQFLVFCGPTIPEQPVSCPSPGSPSQTSDWTFAIIPTRTDKQSVEGEKEQRVFCQNCMVVSYCFLASIYAASLSTICSWLLCYTLGASRNNTTDDFLFMTIAPFLQRKKRFSP